MVVRSVSEVVHGIEFEIFGDDYVRIPNKNQVMLISKNLVENPAYGRHKVSRHMRIVAPIIR